ncbi:hypothetical protein [Natranaeroarchaeum aerophilus]|uniref:Uncharacterized protein n=1 Tax=Natranaeroarchaeum aerophilus TaxID=2917711 RepID=A0AAE3K6H4_9EURY|nr:hypothetical protein [Natranaeroarchaeum aerophilus]MCL9814978.1 hypothetical protein [Natranaeroarchaeum aerophilus]
MSLEGPGRPIFEWLDDGYLERLVVKLNALPSGDQFQREVVEDLEQKLGIAGTERTYEELQDAHGALVGSIEGDEDRLPWWLSEFEWTVNSEQLSRLTLESSTLGEFEEYPRESTYVESIELTGATTFRKTLDALVSLEGELNQVLEADPAALAKDYDIDPSDYNIPDQFFELPEASVATTSSAEEWVQQVISLCPPADPSLTALLRVNVGVKQRHAKKELDDEERQRLETLKLITSDEEDERIFNETYYENLIQLLETDAPFDLSIDISSDKDDLTALQYLFYRSWAENIERRLPEEQRWLQAVKNQSDLDEGEQFRFASYAFRMPIRLDKNQPVFTHQSRYGSDRYVRSQILQLLSEHGHPADND